MLHGAQGDAMLHCASCGCGVVELNPDACHAGGRVCGDCASKNQDLRRRQPQHHCVGCGRVVQAAAAGEHEVTCECGVVSQAVFNSDEEYRIFEPEDEAKRRAESYSREDSAELVPISAADDRTRRWAETRVNQVKMLLVHLDSDEPGRKYLTSDEVRQAAGDLRAATHAYALRPDEAAETASAVFWAIAAAQSVAARRHGEWTIGTEAMVAAWSMDNLHAYLSSFQSESSVTAEKLGNATRVGGGGGMAQAAQLVHEEKRRRLRIDELGNAEARRVKLRTLDALLGAAGRPRLPGPVLRQELPRFVAPPKPVGRALARLAALGEQREGRLARMAAAKAASAARMGLKASSPSGPCLLSWLGLGLGLGLALTLSLLSCLLSCLLCPLPSHVHLAPKGIVQHRRAAVAQVSQPRIEYLFNPGSTPVQQILNLG